MISILRTVTGLNHPLPWHVVRANISLPKFYPASMELSYKPVWIHDANNKVVVHIGQHETDWPLADFIVAAVNASEATAIEAAMPQELRLWD